MADFKDVFKVVGEAPENAFPSDGDIRERIQQDVNANKIVIYMKGTPEMPQCGFSAAVVEVFNDLGVDYVSRNVLADPELRQGIKDFTNWPTIPQIYVNGKFIGGSDIVMEMHDRDELAPLVK